MVKRDNRHIGAGIGFVIAAVVIAVAIYFGIKIGATSNDEPLPEETAPVVTEALPTEEVAPAQQPDVQSQDETSDNGEVVSVPRQRVSDQHEARPGDTRPATPEEEAEIRRIAEEAGMTVTKHGDGYDVGPPDDE